MTTVHIGERYEIDLSTGETTAYYPWAGQPLPMRQGNDLYLLHTDRLGSITNASDASGASIATQRYTAYGSRWATKSSGTLPTDRGFTGQIRDGSRSNFDFYFYRSRYYNSSIGRFVQADSVVSDPKNPQALNRYAYAFNNPLKYVDPTGHWPANWDAQWAADFTHTHGHEPNAQDWADRQFSLQHKGHGVGGAWTGSDWYYYGQVQSIVGGLLSEVGATGGVATAVYTNIGLQIAGGQGVTWWQGESYPGPDGTIIVVTNNIPPNAIAWTWGNAILVRPAYEHNKATLAHEYVHVLQYRAIGISYLPNYILGQKAIANWDAPYERQAVDVQHVYEQDPDLPPPWEFPWAGGHTYVGEQ